HLAVDGVHAVLILTDDRFHHREEQFGLLGGRRGAAGDERLPEPAERIAANRKHLRAAKHEHQRCREVIEIIINARDTGNEVEIVPFDLNAWYFMRIERITNNLGFQAKLISERLQLVLIWFFDADPRARLKLVLLLSGRAVPRAAQVLDHYPYCTPSIQRKIGTRLP